MQKINIPALCGLHWPELENNHSSQKDYHVENYSSPGELLVVLGQLRKACDMPP